MYDKEGAASGDFEFADSLLVLDKGSQAVRDAAVASMAHRRAGTASTLRKGEVAGSNKKPWKQKGLGRARAGYRQSPVWRGGSVAFGPHPRSYGGKLNRKVARLAFKRAFSDKVRSEEVIVIEELTDAEPKTKLIASFLKALKLSGPILVLDEAPGAEVQLAARNLPRVEVSRAADASVYQILRYPTVVVTRAGMGVIEKRFGSGAEVSA